MRIAIIGRSEWLLNAAHLLLKQGHELPLVVTAKGSPEFKAQKEDFESLARQSKGVYHYDPKISAETMQGLMKQTGKIDLAVSINYSGVISQEVIDCFPLGILNAHGGDLPKYRGNACQAWAILNGENRVGLCVHRMVGGELDSGDILARNFFPVAIDTRIANVYEWFDEEIPSLIGQAVSNLSNDPGFVLEKQSKDPADALRCYPRGPEDGRIDWNKSSIEILRLINVSSEPYAGAFGFLNEKPVKIWRASILTDGEKYLGVAGQVCQISESGGSVAIITGKGKLLITEVEYEGVRTVPAKIIRSIRTRLK